MSLLDWILGRNKRVDDTYFFRYLRYTLDDLIFKYADIEKDIQAELVILTLSHFQGLGAVPKGSVFIYKRRPVTVLFQPEINERRFRVTFLETDPIFIDQKLKQMDVEVNEIGFIRHLTIEYPPFLEKVVYKLFPKAIQQLKEAYLAYENALRTKLEKLDNEFTENIYKIIDLELRKKGYKALVGKYHCAVTEISTTNSNFSFEHRYVDSLFEIAKENQIRHVAPIEVIFQLLFTTAIDDSIKYYREKGKTNVTLSLNSMSKKTIQHDFWIAETALTNFDQTISTIYPCQHKDFLLSVNFRTELKDIFDEVINDCSQTIENQFKKNVDRRRFLSLSAMRARWDSRESGPLFDGLKEILTSIAAKWLKEMISP